MLVTQIENINIYFIKGTLSEVLLQILKNKTHQIKH